MTTKCIIFPHEHAVIACSEDNEQLCNVIRQVKSKKDHPYLGIINQINSNQQNELKASYIIGHKWLIENQLAVCVKPKIDKTYADGKSADITKMFMECFANPLVAKDINQVYGIEWDQPKITVKDEENVLTPFIIIHFLNVVKTLAKKGLKKGYITIENNLIAKIKGKILINQTIKHNHFKNRLDKTVCSHQIFTTNCLENQIIKTALIHAARFVYQKLQTNIEILKVLKFDQSMFEHIDTKEINLSDFKKIKHSPFYKEYKEALRLAEMIFRQLGFSLHQADKETQRYTQIPPHHIDMSKLFEKYVELKLRQSGIDIEEQKKVSSNGPAFVQIPDFLLKDPKIPMIIDAKYKYWYKEPISQKYLEDFKQISLYAITDTIRQHLGIEDDRHIHKLFIYPVLGEKEVSKIDFSDMVSYKIKGFIEMYKMGITIPTA